MNKFLGTVDIGGGLEVIDMHKKRWRLVTFLPSAIGKVIGRGDKLLMRI